MSLLESTHQLLIEHMQTTGKSVAEIARDAGDPVKTEWLMKFKNSEIKHPSVVRVEWLHDHLQRAATAVPGASNAASTAAAA